MSDDQQTISIPSLLLLAAFIALAVRYFFFRSSSTPSTSRANLRAANPADVEQIVSMFPQVDRRAIIWDLQRNGGSVAATTERILSTWPLDVPPPSFQPPMPAGGTTPSTTNLLSGRETPQQHIDLIKRYNLTEKIESPELSTSSEGQASGPGSWSNNKNERQALLQRRREEMILSARKKLQQKQKGKMVERA